MSRAQEVCSSKRVYLSAMLAGNMAVLYSWAFGWVVLIPYQCWVCGDWHLTSRGVDEGEDCAAGSQ